MNAGRLALTACLGAASAWPQAQWQSPVRGSASRIVYARLADVAAEPDQPRRPREILTPLATRDPKVLEANLSLFPEPAATLPVSPLNPIVTPSTPTQLTGFSALPDDATAIPPDSHGAVGGQHVLTVLNNNFQVQARDGTVVWQMRIGQFFTRLGPFTTGLFDPRAQYDLSSDRYFVVAAADAQLPATSAICIAVSQTNDPTQGWNQFKISSDPSDTLWFDYPSVGITADWLIISVNLFRRSTYVRTQILVFSKAGLLAGDGSFRSFTETLGTMAPASGVASGGRVPLVSQTSNFRGNGTLVVGEISGPVGIEAYASQAAVVNVGEPWSSTAAGGDFAPQSGSSALIDTGDSRMQNCQVQGGSLWCAHHIFVPAGTPQRTAVQFYQLSTIDYAVQQRGRVEDVSNTTFYAYPSLAVNRNGDMLLGFNRFRGTEFASAVFAMRRASDPLNQLQADVLIKRGEASYQRGTARNRWGDYSYTQVDPVDGVSFWTIQEYASSLPNGQGNRWGTWWARIQPLATRCNFSVSATEFPIPFGGGSVSVTVNTDPACAWMAASDIGWIRLTSGGIGQGTGTVTASVSLNPTADARTSTLTIAGTTVTVRQAGNPSPPSPQLTFSSFTAPTTATVGESFAIRANLSNPSAVGVGRFQVGFRFVAEGAAPSSGRSTPEVCVFANGLGPGVTGVCNINITPPSDLPPSSYQLFAIADDRQETNIDNRATALRVADSGPITLSPSSIAPLISSAGIAHAATAQAGAVSPGQNVILYGQRLGPASLQLFSLQDGRVPTQLAGTRVLFDGVAAPVHYTSSGQVSVFVPFSVAGKTSVQVQAQSGVRWSARVTVPVAPVQPGIYTLNFSGRGQGAIVNVEGGQVNGASTPAARGSVVLLFGTGAGTLAPPPSDGSVIAPPLAQWTASPTEVTVGGIPARVLYSGPAPGLIAGVWQINIEIPATAPVGAAVPLGLRLAGMEAPGGVTLAIR